MGVKANVKYNDRVVVVNRVEYKIIYNMNSFANCEDGDNIYYKSEDGIKVAEMVTCDVCGKFCKVNSISLTSKGMEQITSKMAELDLEELGFCENLGLATCSNCYE